MLPGAMNIDDASDDPDWTREALTSITHEIIAFLTTARAITLHPARFATEWSNGTRRALNPLAFELNAIAVLGPWVTLWSRIIDPDAPATSLGWELVKASLPIAGHVVAMSVCHGFIRLLGGARRLRSTVAIAFYVSGGPLALGMLATRPISLWSVVHPNSVAISALAGGVNLVAFCVMLAYQIAAQAALHRIARWRAAIAILSLWALWIGFWAWVGKIRPNLIRSLLDG
jgi:hypothetical protein